ncbi:MAG: hypothetical protein JWN76_2838 [Chitinophagaceae bacterium]|nr:hypothetical protein [Chitinophagaceae bacterium]
MKAGNHKRPQGFGKRSRLETFTLHYDKVHGWLEVPYEMLTDLEVETKISKRSFRDGDTAYLEEDVDAPLFMDAYLKSKGIITEDACNYVQSRSKIKYRGPKNFIRLLPRFY